MFPRAKPTIRKSFEMEKLKNLQDVSSFYFFVLAFLYIAMVLSIRNGFLPDVNVSLMRILDMPFALVALLYGGTSLALQLSFDEQGQLKDKSWTKVIFVGVFILFVAVALMNLVSAPQI